MDLSMLVIVSSSASVISALASSAVLYFWSLTTRQARQSATLQALQDFMRNIRSFERSLADCKGDPQALSRALMDYIDFLEVCAAIHDQGLVSGLAREFVRDKLIDAADAIEAFPAYELLQRTHAINEGAAMHLRRFMASQQRQKEACATSRKLRRAVATT